MSDTPAPRKSGLGRLLRSTGRWWLIPIASVGALLLLALVGFAATEYIAPFIYSPF